MSWLYQPIPAAAENEFDEPSEETGYSEMSVVFQAAANTTAVQLNGTSSASGALNRPNNNTAPMVASVVNNDAGIAFVKFGASGLTAAATDAPVRAGERAFFMVPQGATHVAVVAPGAATGNVYITLGYAGYGNVS